MRVVNSSIRTNSATANAYVNQVLPPKTVSWANDMKSIPSPSLSNLALSLCCKYFI